MNTLQIPNSVLDDYLNNINLIEPVKRGILSPVMSEGSCYLVSVQDIYLACIENDEDADKVMARLKHPYDILCINGYDSPRIAQAKHWLESPHDYNYAYLKKEKILYELPKGAAIRPLTMEDLDYVYDHYEVVQDYDYLTGRIKAGMLGITMNGTLCGFIGMHTEGTMGLLFIEEGYRKRHLGYCIEAALINQLIEEEVIPFAQVEINNLTSQALQVSLELERSERPVHWYF